MSVVPVLIVCFWRIKVFIISDRRRRKCSGNARAALSDWNAKGRVQLSWRTCWRVT